MFRFEQEVLGVTAVPTGPTPLFPPSNPSSSLPDPTPLFPRQSSSKYTSSAPLLPTPAVYSGPSKSSASSSSSGSGGSSKKNSAAATAVPAKTAVERAGEPACLVVVGAYMYIR